MKSIILIVVLALAHNSLGKPQEFESEHEGNFRIFRHNGGKAVLVPSVSADSEDADVESTVESKDEEQSYDAEHHVEHSHHDKVDCDCNKSKPRITYGPEQVVKGKPETYIHHQPKIIVRQPPTHVRIEHPPTVIHPSTIVFRRHGKTIRRPVIYQHLPQDVRVRPVIVKVVKPIEKKVIVEGKGPECPHVHHKSKHDDHNLEYENESYGGESYGGSFDEQVQVHAHEHESYRAHLNVKETEEF